MNALSHSYTEAELTAMLAELKQVEHDSAKERLESVTPKYRYMILPAIDNFDKLYDESCVFYSISGELLNKDELEAVGWSGHMFSEGSMKYLFNKATGKIVMSVGGGRVYISNPWGSKADMSRDYVAEAYEMVNAFLARYPEGGDITHIIEAHRDAKGEK